MCQFSEGGGKVRLGCGQVSGARAARALPPVKTAAS